MRKLTLKYKHYLQARARYQAKRQTEKWKRRRQSKRISFQKQALKKRKQARKLPEILSAPNNFSLIENSDEVLAYFAKAGHYLRQGENVTLDISNVDSLTPATVALMVASINDKNFMHDSLVQGNAPKKPSLHKLFTESGFYDHVRTGGRFKIGNDSLLHKETNQKVVPEIAKTALLRGEHHVFDRQVSLDSLYEILIECMSNTNSHADLTAEGKCYWWLDVYNDPKQKITSYTFLDLGVGIFRSAAVDGYLKTLTKGTILYPNIRIVDDLLAGKIKSRAKIDTEIRGKGIPQIVENAAASYFRSFYIIANDVKINLKTKERSQLQHPLHGTLLYWELQNA